MTASDQIYLGIIATIAQEVPCVLVLRIGFLYRKQPCHCLDGSKFYELTT